MSRDGSCTSRSTRSTLSEESSKYSDNVLESLNPKNQSKRQFFLDVNPEAVVFTVFDTHLAKEKGQQTLIKTFATETRIIKELQKYMRDSNKKVYPRLGKKYFSVLPLSIAKGSPEYVCELCAGKAVICCSKCTVTYYCGVEHWRNDRMHSVICERMKMIRWPIPFRFSNTERRRLASQKVLIMERMLDDLFKQSYAFMFAREFELAVNTLLQCINYIIPVYGKENQYIPMIVLFTTMCEAQIGLKDCDNAELSVNKAILRLKKLEDSDKHGSIHLTRSQVHKAHGLLHFARAEYDLATVQFSQGIYFVTEVLGPTHFRAVPGYYHLARCFLAKGEREIAMAMVCFSVDVSLDFIFDLICSVIPDPWFWSHSWDQRTSLFPSFYEIQLIEILRGILTVISDQDSEIEGRIIICEAMLMFLRKFNGDAKRQLNFLTQIHDFERDLRIMGMIRHLRQAIITEEHNTTILAS